MLRRNVLMRMPLNVYWPCRTSWSLFLRARSRFWEFLLAWCPRTTVSIEPWTYQIISRLRVVLWFQIIDRLAMTVKVDKPLKDTRRCCFCHEMGDGDTNGAGRWVTISWVSWHILAWNYPLTSLVWLFLQLKISQVFHDELLIVPTLIFPFWIFLKIFLLFRVFSSKRSGILGFTKLQSIRIKFVPIIALSGLIRDRLMGCWTLKSIFLHKIRTKFPTQNPTKTSF